MNFKKYNLALIIFFVFLYKSLLELSYFVFLNPNYDYYGFTLEINIFKFIESSVYFIILLIIVPKNEQKPSSIVIYSLFLIMIIPHFSIYWLKNENRVFMFMVFISFFITILLVKFIPQIKISKRLVNKKLLYFLVTVNTIITISVLLLFNGLPSLAALNFNNVYSIREKINYGFPIMQYLVTWQSVILNVFMVIILWVKQKKMYSLFFVIIQILTFLITGHKSFLFYILIIPIVLYIFKKKKYIILFPFGLIVGLIVGLVAYYLIDFWWIASLLISRVLFLPAQISFQYYEFFSENKFMQLTHSIFEMFSKQPVYEKNPIAIIGETYYDSNWPNTGYLGDSYMNFGIFGMLVFSILFSILLKFFDSLAIRENNNNIVILFFSVIFTISFMNVGFFTSLLTGGIIVFLIIAILYSDEGK